MSFTHWHGDMEAQYIYTAGIAGERFFRELKDNGKLVGTRCPKCDITYMPPRMSRVMPRTIRGPERVVTSSPGMTSSPGATSFTSSSACLAPAVVS